MIHDLALLIRRTRQRHCLTQSQLALRAGTTQAVVSRIEAGLQSPTFEMASRLLLVMGERIELGSVPLSGRFDPAHLAVERSLTPGQRLERAFAWTTFNDELRQASRRAGA